MHEPDNERALIVSSDGHAVPRMRDYRDYLPQRMHETFDEYCDFWDEHGALTSDPHYLKVRLDETVVERWKARLVDTGRLEGCHDPVKRLTEMENEGIVAEVLFPDFGLPFEAPSTQLFGTERRIRSHEEIDEGNRAFNRWLADFCSVAPERFCGMAMVAFDDVERALDEITWAREAGLKGLVLPTFTPEHPVFHERFDPIWSLLEDLDMPVNSHATFSATVQQTRYSGIPHPAVETPLHTPELMFRCHELLAHLIFGGVFERHPRLRAAFTEQGSAWLPAALETWDSSFEASFMRRDVREVLPEQPSEYFRRQCWLGSSIFSRAEVQARDWIGVDAMCLGMDYPHQEGTFYAGTTRYLRATLGAAGVRPEDARKMLGENAIERWDLDTGALRHVADRCGPDLDVVLTPPDGVEISRGDVRKALNRTL